MVPAATAPACGVMIRFTDAQIATLRELAAPLAPWRRRESLEIVAERLAGTEIGDGSVHAAALAAQARGARHPQGLVVMPDDPVSRLSPRVRSIGCSDAVIPAITPN
jgi:hypothetical protein